MQRKIMIRSAALVITMLGAPLAFSPEQGVTINQACAQNEKKPDPGTGTCCYQAGSICVTPTANIGNYYFKSEGAC
jgi:hypothetical protein